MEEPALRNDDDRIVFGFLFDKPVVRIAAVGAAVAVGQDESERGGAAVGRDDVCRPAFFFADDVEERAQMGGMRVADEVILILHGAINTYLFHQFAENYILF